MNEEIKELLFYYKQERDLIDSIIVEDLIDFDYQSVHLNSITLNKIKRKISLLEKLINPKTAEIEDQKRAIDSALKMINSTHLDSHKDYISSQIDQKLDILNSYKPAYFNDGQEFDDAIFDLVESKIQGFIFHLKKSDDIALIFSKNNEELCISIKKVKKLKKKYILEKSARTALKAIGFKKVKELNSLIYHYDLSDFKDSIFIKTIVSRVIYDAFQFQTFDNPTILEILP
ncbi:hypothetical protein GJU39_11685 [Pedobacter petrophilus]|uniref:Uncharacterized protein n=1 Tax=Pedobacter petrophilus TaxID=1908241 RepID=A0A7K0G0K7_9SPHI|nr:hypothetical protein [Pedobacter petrophilus]MRX76749.1 hypothetical protein [Pedobacter petrophilus]